MNQIRKSGSQSAPRTLLQRICAIPEDVNGRISKARRRARFVKIRFFLLFVLPVTAVLLAYKAAQTYIGIILRRAGMNVPQTSHSLIVSSESKTEKNQSRLSPEPAQTERFRPEFVTPEPVETLPIHSK